MVFWSMNAHCLYGLKIMKYRLSGAKTEFKIAYKRVLSV